MEKKIIASLTIKGDYKETLVPVLEGLVEKSRQEAGNIAYSLNQDVENPFKYVFLETWQDDTVIECHNATPHFQNFLTAIDGKLESLDITTVTQVK